MQRAWKSTASDSGVRRVKFRLSRLRIPITETSETWQKPPMARNALKLLMPLWVASSARSAAGVLRMVCMPEATEWGRLWLLFFAASSELSIAWDQHQSSSLAGSTSLLHSPIALPLLCPVLAKAAHVSSLLWHFSAWQFLYLSH